MGAVRELIIANAVVPGALTDDGAIGRWHIVVRDAKVDALLPSDGPLPLLHDAALVDAAHGVVISRFVDCHTHLDKAHLASFFEFPELGLIEAIASMEATKPQWTEKNLIARVTYALNRARSHGVRAIRTHVDMTANTPSFVLPTMRALCDTARVQGIELHLAPLIPLERVEEEPWFSAFARACRDLSGVIGFFVFKHNCSRARVERAFDVARNQGLMLDFHVDEGLDPDLKGLAVITEIARETAHAFPILCGHNISLALRAPDGLARELDAIAAAKITLAMMPHANLFVQDRAPGRTPRARGLMPIIEARSRGIATAIGTDNVCDGFYPYGDHDPLAALALAATTAHLPDPLDGALDTITTTPARAMQLPWDGRIAVGGPADLICFPGRSKHGVLNSLGAGRQVVIGGRVIEPLDVSEHHLTREGALA